MHTHTPCRFVLAAALGVTFASTAHAGFRVNSPEYKPTVHPTPHTAHVSVPDDYQLSGNRRLKYILITGHGDPGAVAGHGSHIPLNAAIELLIPDSWVSFANPNVDTKELVSWDADQSWVDALRGIAVRRDLQFSVDFNNSVVRVDPMPDHSALVAMSGYDMDKYFSLAKKREDARVAKAVAAAKAEAKKHVERKAAAQNADASPYRYNADGYDAEGFDREGYNKAGFDKAGYNRQGYDKNGLDNNGFGIDGYDANGYDADGYNRSGFDRDGLDKNGHQAGWEPPKADVSTSDADADNTTLDVAADANATATTDDEATVVTLKTRPTPPLADDANDAHGAKRDSEDDLTESHEADNHLASHDNGAAEQTADTDNAADDSPFSTPVMSLQDFYSQKVILNLTDVSVQDALARIAPVGWHVAMPAGDDKLANRVITRLTAERPRGQVLAILAKQLHISITPYPIQQLLVIVAR